ncbi:MAG TPA: hypothetical protein VG324_04890 [Blastocatellia bacterium]|nr:hypothetical protein [Blastocatellia bacterium]
MLSDKINRLPISRVDPHPPNSYDEQNAVILINKQGNILSFEHARRNSGAGIDRDRSENTTSTAPPDKPVANNLNNATAEVERRRAELAAMARAAEARAKQAEEKCEQAEGRLEQELKDRMLAEQRLKELEENRLRQRQVSAPVVGPQSRTSAWAQGGMGVRLKDSEPRAGVSETEIQTLMVALMEADQKRAKAEALAQAADDKTREFEAKAEAGRIALVEANRKMAESEAAGRQATERYQTIEAELQYEAKQRAAAEEKLKEFEDELGSYLELDWSNGEPDQTRAVVARDGGGADEVVLQLQAQAEAERRARRQADDARAALELRMREMEKALRIAEENNRQIAALNLAKSAGEDHTYTIKKRKGFKYELRFIFYGMAIALLLVTLIGLIATIFLQI